MANNFQIVEGGTLAIRTLAAEETGGALYQKVKQAWGDAGTANLVSLSNPLPVQTITAALPTGASTSANQTSTNTKLDSVLAALAGSLTVAGTVGLSGSVTVGSSALPTGAATAAKQPALGTAGSPSTDVLSIQGVTSGVPIISNLTQVNGNAILTGNGVAGTGSPRVVIASDQTAFSVLATFSPKTSGGLSVYRNISLLATGINIKSSAGMVYEWAIYNDATTTRYVKFYNLASAPTVGTTTPFLTIAVPAGSTMLFNSQSGIEFTAGIGIGATQLVADNNTTAPSANEVQVNVMYK